MSITLATPCVTLLLLPDLHDRVLSTPDYRWSRLYKIVYIAAQNSHSLILCCELAMLSRKLEIVETCQRTMAADRRSIYGASSMEKP